MLSSPAPRAAVFGAAALLLAACSPSAPGPAASAPAAPAPSPAARSAETIATIHHALLIPGSEVLYSAESAPPEIAAAWKSVQDSAAKVARGAEQLSFGRTEGDAWTGLTRQLAAAAKASAAASAASNPEQLRAANEGIAAACTGCHQAYVKPAP